MKTLPFLKEYQNHPCISKVANHLSLKSNSKIQLKGLVGAQDVILTSQIIHQLKSPHFFVFSDKEEAAYFLNDLENITAQEVLFYPSSYRRPYQIEETDNANILLRLETLNLSLIHI